MRTSEAFLLRKSQYGEADYIMSFFTKDFGKINGLAKHAKKSKKRFGGRVEPFVHLRVRFKERSNGFHFILDTETIDIYPKFMEDVDLYTLGSFVLENIDNLVLYEQKNEKLFDLLVYTLSSLNSGKSPLPVILSFQLYALSYSGYTPNLRTCSDCGKKVRSAAVFCISKGGIVCQSCDTKRTNTLKVSRNFLTDQDLMEKNLTTVFKYIKLFTKFTEYYTEKKFKSSRFIQEPKL